MKSSQEDIDILHQYLKGRLSAEASSAVEKRLAAEADLQDNYRQLKILTEGMRVSVLSDKLAMLQNWEKKEDHAQNAKGNWWKWIGIFFLCCLLGYLLYNYAFKEGNEIPKEYKVLYAQRFDAELILHNTKRSAVQTDSLSQEQRRAYEMYSIQLFDDAIPLLETLWETKRDTLALFYLGVSYIGVGKKDKGLKVLKRPELSNYSKQTNIIINH